MGNDCFVTVKMPKSEMIQNLKGRIENVYMFSDDNIKVKSRVSKRGIEHTSVYFLINKDYRDGIQQGSATMHRINADKCIYYIFKVKKEENKEVKKTSLYSKYP